MSSNGNRTSRIAIVLSLMALFAALAGGAYAASKIGSKDIKPNAVKSKQIKDGAVKNAELANGAVSTDKLAGGAVDATTLADGSVTTNKLADGAVSSAKLGDAAVSTAKLGDGAVTSAKAGAGVLRDMVIVEDREPDAGFTVSASKQSFATCPADYVITGGGTRILGDGGLNDEIIVTDLPIVASAPGLTQWFGQADDGIAGDNDDWALATTAICVKA